MGGRLEGNVALITGAASGQGAAHADLFTREGAAVVLGDIDEDVVVARAERLRGTGFAADGLTLDVTRADDWASAVALAEERFGHLDVS